jgi:hypothetical protein
MPRLGSFICRCKIDLKSKANYQEIFLKKEENFFGWLSSSSHTILECQFEKRERIGIIVINIFNNVASLCVHHHT